MDRLVDFMYECLIGAMLFTVIFMLSAVVLTTITVFIISVI